MSLRLSRPIFNKLHGINGMSNDLNTVVDNTLQLEKTISPSLHVTENNLLYNINYIHKNRVIQCPSLVWADSMWIFDTVDF